MSKAEIEKTEIKLKELQEEIITIKSYLRGLKFTTNSRDKKKYSTKTPFTLREGTELARVKIILEQAQDGLHVNDIVARLNGGVPDRNKKMALASTLNSYCHQERIFKKVGRNIFTVITPILHL